MAAEKPTRLKLPKAVARSARSVLPDLFAIPDTTPIIRLIPIVQWHQFRVRLLITGDIGVVGLAFVRPERQADPAVPEVAYEYLLGQPAVDGTAWVDGTELVLSVTGAEHHGENWAKLTLTAAGACTVNFIDVMGDLHGLHS